MSTKCIVSQYVSVEECTYSEIMDVVSGAEREHGSGKSDERQRSGEWEAAERSGEQVSQK